MNIESFVVRIYRYNPKRPDQLVGTLEKADFKVPLAFSNLEELWNAIKLCSYQVDTNEKAFE